VVALAYLAGKLAYRLRDVILLIAVAGFIALILNPLVVYVQRRIPRRGWAVAIVTVWAAVVFTGLRRVAPVHCCTGAPKGPCMRVSAHTAQASR